ncbi:hypothetical protein N5853_12095 [Bartonella sp. HY329]|uniref:hypothetical protein n=1 Tax=unclassified Bartonella TaxID=2645622 RepID=UPI0021C722E0|nr:MULTISPECIES: hypothetical protein [unclassified Bartonella]UXM94819.1 hypothetical protein N5853_12095 [Bartonella sp. HY329]UXN09142.1 hypothetical protein N5852_12105 [Bartonella sp. HY328]
MRRISTAIILSISFFTFSSIAPFAKSRECSDKERLAFYDDVMLSRWLLKGQIIAENSESTNTDIYLEENEKQRLKFSYAGCASHYCINVTGVKGDKTSIIVFVNYFIPLGIIDEKSKEYTYEGSSTIFITDNDFCTFQNTIDEENGQSVHLMNLNKIVQMAREGVEDDYKKYKSGDYKKFEDFTE